MLVWASHRRHEWLQHRLREHQEEVAAGLGHAKRRMDAATKHIKQFLKKQPYLIHNSAWCGMQGHAALKDLPQEFQPRQEGSKRAQPPSVSPPAAKIARVEAAERSVELQAAPSTVPQAIVQDLRHKLGCLSNEESENLWERLGEAGILPDSDDDLDVDALAPGDLALLREEVAKSVARCAQPPSVSPPAAKVARTEAAEGSVELQAAPSTVPREIVQDLRHKLGCLSDEELENLWERLGEAGIFPDADDDLDVDALSPVELALLREEVDQSLARCASPHAAKIARIETAGASLAVAAHGGPEVAPDDLAAADEPDAQNGDECDALAGASETGESSEAAGDAEFAAAAPAPAAEAGRALAPAAEAEPSPAPAPALAAEAEPAPAPDPAPAAGAGPAPAPAPAPAAEAGPAPEPQEIVEDLMHKLACLSVAESENLWERLGAAGILPDDAGDDRDLDVDALSPEDLALLREEVAKSFARCAQPPVSPSPPPDAKRLEISPDDALELDATSNGRDAGDVAEPTALAPALADEEEMFGELEAELGAA